LNVLRLCNREYQHPVLIIIIERVPEFVTFVPIRKCRLMELKDLLLGLNHGSSPSVIVFHGDKLLEPLSILLRRRLLVILRNPLVVEGNELRDEGEEEGPIVEVLCHRVPVETDSAETDEPTEVLEVLNALEPTGGHDEDFEPELGVEVLNGRDEVPVEVEGFESPEVLQVLNPLDAVEGEVKVLEVNESIQVLNLCDDIVREGELLEEDHVGEMSNLGNGYRSIITSLISTQSFLA
jgi:hypothetical protein